MGVHGGRNERSLYLPRGSVVSCRPGKEADPQGGDVGERGFFRGKCREGFFEGKGPFSGENAGERAFFRGRCRVQGLFQGEMSG